MGGKLAGGGGIFGSPILNRVKVILLFSNFFFVYKTFQICYFLEKTYGKLKF